MPRLRPFIFRQPSDRAYAADIVIGFGRIVAAALSGAHKAVMVSIRAAEGTADDAPTEDSEEPLYGQLGVVARPRRAVAPEQATGLDPEGYTEIVGVRSGDSVTPIGTRDLRLNARVNPTEGEIDIVQYGGGFIGLRAASDGRGTEVTIYAPHLASDGSVEKAGVISMDPVGGNVLVAAQDGAAIALTPESATIKSPAGDTFVEASDEQLKVSAPRSFTRAGSWQVYVPNADNTQAHNLIVDNELNTIQLAHRSGAGIVFTPAGDIVFRSASGLVSLTLNDQGVFLNGNLKVQGKGFFGNPLLWAAPTSTVIIGLTGMYGTPSASLVATPTP